MEERKALTTSPRADSVLLVQQDKAEEVEHSTRTVLTRPREASKEQCKERLAYYFRWSLGGKINADPDMFQRVMGKPVHTQTMQSGMNVAILWYYECSDGTIQLSIRDTRLLSNGTLQAELNDY